VGWLAPPLISFIAIGIALIATRPGLQGDEAHLIEGVIRLLRREDLVQLMEIPYIGSAKSYLLFPVFLATGVNIELARVLNLVFGGVAIVAVGDFARRRFGGTAAGMAAALVLGTHPGFIGWVVFDNTGLALLMAGIGAVLLTFERFDRIESFRAALLLGAAVGFAGWVRANFVWQALALVVAFVAVRRSALAGSVA